MITRNNYEHYIIDFYDGKLNKLQVEELYAFLDLHADLKEEFELLSNATLEAEPVVYADKNSLKKTVSSESELLIAYFENDLNPAEKKNVEQKMNANPQLAQELEIIKKTRLLPDYTILFGDKSSLKHTAKVVSFSTSFYRNLSIAASVILIAIAYFIFRPQSDQKMMVDGDKKVLPVQSPTENKSVAPAPVANITSPERSVDKNKQIPVKEKRTVPSSNLAQIKDSKEISNPGEKVIKEEIAPKNNLAIDSKKIIPEEDLQQPMAVNETKHEGAAKQETIVTDLSEIFTQAELAELGLTKNSPTPVKSSGNILDYAASKLKHFSDSKDINVVKKENYVDDATTYAVNVGEKFSVSHTRRR